VKAIIAERVEAGEIFTAAQVKLMKAFQPLYESRAAFAAALAFSRARSLVSVFGSRRREGISSQ
jgi:hypothetical protein